MVEGCGDKCCKYLFLFVNLILFIGGVVCLALGIWAAVDKSSFLNVLSQIPSSEAQQQNVPGLLQSSAYILIVAGALITIMSFLACCGAMKENKCLLGIFAGLVIIFIILLLAAAIVGFVFRSQITSGLQEALIKSLEMNYDGKLNSSDSYSRAIDSMQVEYGCCGIKSYMEFRNATKWVHTSGVQIPVTCCVLKDKAAYFNNLQAEPKSTQCQNNLVESYTDKPCFDSLSSDMMSKIGAVIGIALGILALMVVSVVFACCIMRAIDQNKMNVA